MIEFDAQIDNRFTQWMNMRADAKQQETALEIIAGLQSGTIQIPQEAQNSPNYAGGTNFCPNSDLKYSKMAAELATTPPDENFECWRFFRQPQNQPIDLTGGRLKADGHSGFAAAEGTTPEIPVWNRTEGCLEFGSSGGSAYDVAVRLLNNHINAAETWFVRFQLLAISDDLVPDDLEMFVGIWQKTASGEGWITGEDFNLTYKIFGAPGTRTIRYKIVARTDGKNELYSQILTITDAPNVLSEDRFIRVMFSDTKSGGFIEFDVYREIGGVYQKIRSVRNADSLLIDDDEETNSDFVPVSGFPASTNTLQTAIAYSSSLDIGRNGAAYIWNDFRIDIPAGYNFGATLQASQFLRFGFTRFANANRKIRLDKIWLSPSYNVWSDSPLDPSNVPPTSAPVDVPPPAGSGGTYQPPPSGGGGYCVLDDVPILRINFDREREFLPYREIPNGDVLESGAQTTRKNVVLRKKTGKSRVFWRVYFSNNSWVYVTRHHRFRVSREKQTRSIENLTTGSRVWGWTETNGEMREAAVRIVFKELILVKDARRHGTFSLKGESNFYIAGFSKNGKNGVFNKNRKFEPELAQPVV